jgi:geranylgeranyl pyrophosphate synthase
MSTSDWYNEIEISIANLTSQGLFDALNKFEGIERLVLANLFEKKIKQNKNFRPLVFFIGYCLAKGDKIINVDDLSSKERDIIKDVTTAIEVENIATYYINHYLDRKSDIKDEQDEKNRVMAGVMCRNIQQSIIEKTDLNIEIKMDVIKILREIDQDIARAQIHEVNVGIFKNLSQFEDEDNFLKIYFERCRNISGQFYGRCAEIGYVIGSGGFANQENRQKIKNFYTEMATIGQFGNDIGDYASADTHTGTMEKNYYKDYGSDLRNQRLTYPNYLLLKRLKNDQDKEFISSIIENGFTNQSGLEFIALMNKLNVFKDCFLLLNKRFNEQKKKLDLPKSDLRTLISSSVIVMRSNKLINSVKKAINVAF